MTVAADTEVQPPRWQPDAQRANRLAILQQLGLPGDLPEQPDLSYTGHCTVHKTRPEAIRAANHARKQFETLLHTWCGGAFEVTDETIGIWWPLTVGKA